MQSLIYSVLLSFAVCILLGPVVIPLLKRLKFGQMVRDDGPKSHLVKAGTPTMGGVIIFMGLIVGTLVLTLTSYGSMEFVLPALLITMGFGLIGFLDDFIKIRRKRSLGLKAYQKIIGQLAFALIMALYAYNNPLIGSKIFVPFANIEWDLGVWYIPFIVFVVIAAVNSVNLTDGLDGLAAGTTLIYAATFNVILYFMAAAAGAGGQVLLSKNLEGLMIFAGALCGACMGFLRFNTYPAKVFMGDTGSLALGSAVSVLAIFSRCTLLLPIMGGVFVASSVSVILQVGSFKLRHGKRIFKMAPLHHHFELLGMPETRIVSMYMIVTTLLCLVGLLASAWILAIA